MSRRSPVHVALLLTCIVLQAGCVNPAMDRFEPANRVVFEFNEQLDNYVMEPVARGYAAVTPEPVQNGVYNFFVNLGYPTVILNQFLQGKPDKGVQDTARLLINSTLGVAGVMDVAAGMGLPRHEEDFGQTFGVWGIEPGAYLVAPVWGAITVRSGIGDLLDSLIFPARFVENAWVRNGTTALLVISTRAELLEVNRLIRGQRYVFFRDSYLQRREYLVNDGEVDDPFLDDGF